MNALILLGFVVLAILDVVGVVIQQLTNMKVSQLAAQLAALSQQVTKSRTEVLKKIADLEASLSDVDLPEEATTALEALKAEVQTSDDVVPDEETPPTGGTEG